MIRFCSACCLLLCLCPVSTAVANELHWTYTPPAVYAGDHIQLAFSLEQGRPQIEAADIGDSQLSGGTAGHWTLHLSQLSPGTLTLRSAEKQWHLRFVAPGDALAWEYHPGQGLRTDDGTVVILLPQRWYRDRDRRYQLLRPSSQRSVEGGQLLWPQSVRWGASPLLASLATWRRSNAQEGPLVLVIDRRELLVGWDPGIFAASLAWISQDLEQRGHSIAFLAPIAHPDEAQALQFLSAALDQVGQDQSLDLIRFPALTDIAYWMHSKGVSGLWLNASGREHLAAQLIKQGLHPDTVPENGLLP